MLSMQNVIKTALEQFNDMIIVETDKDIASLFAGADEPLVAQSAQLMGDGGFGQSQTIHQFTDTNFSIKQSADDENACRVAQRVEQAGKIGCDFRGDVLLWHRLNPATDTLLVILVSVAIFLCKKSLFQPHLNMDQNNAKRRNGQGGGGGQYQ